jgi:hypothetical protein
VLQRPARELPDFVAQLKERLRSEGVMLAK